MPKGSKVLMADDDKMLLDMYKERLELAGYTVQANSNGEEALAHVKDFDPDIIMLDVMMPKMNGYETLASIKSDPTTKNIPVVMLSALMRDFNREKAVEGGAEDYLIKSEAMPSDVITKIEQVLQKYGKGSRPVPGKAVETEKPVFEPVAAAADTEPVKNEISAEAKVESVTPKMTEEQTKVTTDSKKPVNPPAKNEAIILSVIVIVLVLITAGFLYYFLVLNK